MRLLFKIILIFFITNKIFTAQLTYDVYGYYDFLKFFKVSENRSYIVMNNNTVVLTNIGVTGKSNCTGVIEVSGSETLFSNIMCKYTEANGDTNFTQFKTEKGAISEGAGINSFIFVSGEGRWAELVGQKCIGAFSEITSFEENMKNATFEWKGKCELPNKTLERVKNYKKPE